MTELDRDRLNAALDLAQQAIGVSDPNPRVGCVLGREDGSLIASGFTQEAGGMHAEASAIAAALAAGQDLGGATAWVSLEPCAHHGRTPPCCEALVTAGIARVVVAIRDPFPQVDGAGIEYLRASGVRVDMADKAFAARARDINIGFFSRIERGRPWVRMKVAASLDGRTALHSGASQWITGPDARKDGHTWRKRASAVLTGIGTVLMDDPRLDVRHVPTRIQPLRIVVDSTLKIPLHSKVLEPPGARLVVSASDPSRRSEDMRRMGVDVLVSARADGQVDLANMLVALARMNVNELHVEAGARLNAALFESQLVDELVIYLAPKLIGEGLGMVAMGPLESLAKVFSLRFDSVQMVGEDMRVCATPLYRPFAGHL